MSSVILVFLGVVLMFVSVGLGILMISDVWSKEVRNKLVFLFVLIVFFLIGYIAYLISLLLLLDNHEYIELLLALILFFGSVFVLCGTLVIKSMVYLLKDRSDEVDGE